MSYPAVGGGGGTAPESASRDRSLRHGATTIAPRRPSAVGPLPTHELIPRNDQCRHGSLLDTCRPAAREPAAVRRYKDSAPAPRGWRGCSGCGELATGNCCLSPERSAAVMVPGGVRTGRVSVAPRALPGVRDRAVCFERSRAGPGASDSAVGGVTASSVPPGMGSVGRDGGVVNKVAGEAEGFLDQGHQVGAGQPVDHASVLPVGADQAHHAEPSGARSTGASPRLNRVWGTSISEISTATNSSHSAASDSVKRPSAHPTSRPRVTCRSPSTRMMSAYFCCS